MRKPVVCYDLLEEVVSIQGPGFPLVEVGKRDRRGVVCVERVGLLGFPNHDEE